MGEFKPNNRGFDRGRSSGRFNSRPGGFGGRSGEFGGRSGGFGGRGGDRGGGFNRGPVEMHDATCDKCGKQCQVPFRPSGDKPIFCSDCFRQKEESREGGRSFSPRGSNSTSESSGAGSQQISQINAKLDKILLALQEIELVVEDEAEEAEESNENLDEDSDTEK